MPAQLQDVSPTWTIHEVDDPTSLPPALFGTGEAHNTRHRLALNARDPRLRTTFLVACPPGESTPVAALPVSRPLQRGWHDSAYDPGNWGYALASADARDYLLVGGTTDLREVLLVGALQPTELAGVLDRLWERILEISNVEGRFPLAQFAVSDGPLAEAALRTGAMRLEETGERFVIVDVGTDLSSYLATLDRRRRSVVRRDLRDIEAAGIRTTTVPWHDLPSWAFVAVSDVRARYAPSSPRLVSFRLRQLAADPDVEAVAFVAHSEAGVQGVSLGWIRPGCLELYEVGLSGPESGQTQAYLEVMFYAPLRLLWARGGGTLDLAMEARRPKTLRGALAIRLCGVLAHDAFVEGTQ